MITTFSSCPTRRPKTFGTRPWNPSFSRRWASQSTPRWFTRRGIRHAEDCLVVVAAVRVYDSVGVLPGSGRAAGQYCPHCRTAPAACRNSSRPSSGPNAQPGADAVAGCSLLSLDLLYVFLDHRLARHSGKGARILPGDDAGLAGVGVRREPRRSAHAVARLGRRLVGAGLADPG